ncbi:hypothetical protein [Rhizobium sp. RCC_161_2]|uniref:hypothetical protein n=1 Tax=Rhizobium sp. RCC_161_2 TaxID=3239219 RepID=UPI00352405CC
MCDQQILSGNEKRASAIAVALSFLMLSGCATTGDKPKLAETPTPPNAAEQLADSLNSNAEAKRLKGDVAYRDPLVRSVHGVRRQIVSEQANDQSAFPPAPITAQGVPTDIPAGIGGLVTQPTAVNASRSSIYAAPAPIAVNPDGTLAKTQQDAGQQGITPFMRSVYTLPPSAAQNVAPQQGDGGMPVGRTSEAVLPPPVIRNAAPPSTSPMKPTADATPSKIMPARGSSARRIDSKEALMLAHIAASKGQGTDTKPLIAQTPSATGL